MRPPAYELVGWCDACQAEMLTTDAGACRCCGRTTRRKRGGGKPAGKWGKLTDRQLQAAHTLYVVQRVSLRGLGALLWEQHGYASAKSCSMALHYGFRRLGLPMRDRIEAAVAASTTHGLATAERRATSDPDYLALRRRQKLARGEIAGRRCRGVRRQYPRKGAPCQRAALAGSDFCIAHDPERAAWREANLAAARGRLAVAA